MEAVDLLQRDQRGPSTCVRIHRDQSNSTPRRRFQSGWCDIYVQLNPYVQLNTQANTLALKAYVLTDCWATYVSMCTDCETRPHKFGDCLKVHCAFRVNLADCHGGTESGIVNCDGRFLVSRTPTRESSAVLNKVADVQA